MALKISLVTIIISGTLYIFGKVVKRLASFVVFQILSQVAAGIQYSIKLFSDSIPHSYPDIGGHI